MQQPNLQNLQQTLQKSDCGITLDPMWWGIFMENENKGNIVIYQSNDGLTKIDVKFEDETVWLTQQQMAELYKTSRTNVVEHIKHIYEEGELDESSTCRNFRQVQTEGKRQKLMQWNRKKCT